MKNVTNELFGHTPYALGYEAIKQGKEVFYRSIFDRALIQATSRSIDA